jgi:phenylpropionate dioxygenase-like ring-hydroxylating dioxygenase large terminal subunit
MLPIAQDWPAGGAVEQDEECEPVLSADLLFDFWYCAIRGSEVRRRRMVRVTLLDRALVVGRDRQGRAFALVDACPHRGMPLSYGWFDGDVVQCSFHGWRFDARTGQCRFVPSCTAAQKDRVSRLRAGHVPCEERDGLIWVYLAGARPDGRRSTPPGSPTGPPPALPVFSERYRHFSISMDVPIGADHAQVSFLDPAHGPFVHRTWWLLARVLFAAHEDETRVVLEPIPLGFREVTVTRIKERWSVRLAGSDTANIEVDCVLPHLRIGRFRFGKYWLTGLVSVTPISADRCRVDQLVAWNVLFCVPFVATVLKLLFWLFLVQDRRNLARQAEGLRRIRRLEWFGDADRAARYYQQIKGAYLEARRTGGEMVHPMRGPVSLHYRNPTVNDIGRPDDAPW